MFIFTSNMEKWQAEDVLAVKSDDKDYLTFLEKMGEFFNKKEDQKFKFLKSDEKRWVI